MVRDSRRCIESPPIWPAILGATLTLLFAGATVAFIVTGHRIATDAALYQHVGWAVTQGAVPYVDVWDVNPPVTFAVTTLLALLAGGNLVALHVLGVVVSFVAVGVGVMGTASVAHEVTGDDAAALVAGFVLLVPAEVWGLPPQGIRSQYLALGFGVAGLALALRERPMTGGAAVALAAGAWQPSAALAPIVVGLAARRGGRWAALRALGAGLLVTVLVVAPFVVAGAAGPMVVETVLAPLVARAPYTVPGRTYALARAMGYGVLLLPVALVGWVLVASDRRDLWWIAAGGAVYTGQLVFLNMNGSLDALLWLVFVALGVALVVARLSVRRRRVAVGLAVVLICSGLAWHLAPAVPLRESLEDRHRQARPSKAPPIGEDAVDVPSMPTIYWEGRRPDSCHYRLSWTELRWVARTDAALDDETCGRWPDRSDW